MDKLTLLTTPVSDGATLPEATSFDGSTDYLNGQSFSGSNPALAILRLVRFTRFSAA